MAIQLHPSIAVHPGALLREDVFPSLRHSKSDIATMLRISRQHLYDVLGEKKPITPQMALRLGKLLGNRPNLWLSMQQNYDLATQGQAMAEELAAIPQLEMAVA